MEEKERKVFHAVTVPSPYDAFHNWDAITEPQETNFACCHCELES